jgi:tetratricopeptide (TPR) repeat protein
MGTKEVMVTAPVVVLLYDRTFLSGSFREALRRHRVSYLGLAATWILLGYLVMTGGGLSHHAGENERAGWWAYALTETGVIVHYLRLAIWPEPLCLDYRWPITTNWPAMLPRAVVVAGLLGATVWACQRRLLWGFLGAWFFLILALTSSVFKLADPAFEHRMYLPLAAVVTLVVLGGFKLRERLAGCGQKFSRNIARGVVGVAVISLAALTVRRNHDYRSELAIWQDTILKRPNNPRVWSSLGTIALKSGDMESAARHLNEALRLKPDYAEAHHNLGLYFYRLGRVQEAVSHYEQALQFRPDLAVGHNNLGNLLVQTGKVREGIQHLKQALRLRPDYPEAYYNLGVAAAQTGKIAEAIGYYAQAVRLLPDYPEAHNNWASALLQLGKPAEALGHIEQALRLKPDYAEAQCNLALLYSRTGRIDDAIRVYEKVLQRKPDYAEAHCGLGILLAQTGKLAAATRHFEQAVLSKPDYADAHNNLGNALMLTGHAPEAIAHYEQALRIRPNYVDASNNLARARAALAGEPNQTK